jgi:hypothetical protein
MNLYLVMLLVHVAAAVALLSGSIVGLPVIRLAVRRAATTQEVRAYLSIGSPLLVLEPASALVLLATGAYLASVTRVWSLGWVQVAVAAWVVNAVVAGGLVKPLMGRLRAASLSAPDGAVGGAINDVRWSSRWSLGGDVVLANDAAMLYLMVVRPGLGGSLIAVAAANLVVASVRLVSRPRVAVGSAVGVSTAIGIWPATDSPVFDPPSSGVGVSSNADSPGSDGN